jgi:RecA-family ATPase
MQAYRGLRPRIRRAHGFGQQPPIAVGKTVLLLQLSVCVAALCPWLGMTPANGPALVISAEEEIDELHRRLADISVALGVKLEDLRDLHLIDLAGKDAVMATPDGRASIIKPTPLWRGVASMVADIRPKLVVLDTAADIYAGNENIRPEVRQFIGILRGLAIERDLAVALSSHPSLTGLSTGSGTSGSTQAEPSRPPCSRRTTTPRASKARRSPTPWAACSRPTVSMSRRSGRHRSNAKHSRPV